MNEHEEKIARPIAKILMDLDGLQASDFQWNKTARGVESLDSLMRELEDLGKVETAVEPLFRLMERAPEADFGAPGAIVHWLEKQPDYAAELLRSLQRHPTPTTVWMVNRIINSLDSPSELWLSHLENAAQHSLATTTTRESALDFLEYQLKRQHAAP